jgi:hypothetical protein
VKFSDLRTRIGTFFCKKKGFSEPLWVITNIEPQRALKIYKARMKIEESFKDMKDILGMEKVMNKKQENMDSS